jgi:hypothetical protein
MDNYCNYCINNLKIQLHNNFNNELFKKINDVDKTIEILKNNLNDVLFLEEYNHHKDIFKQLMQDEQIYFIKQKEKYINLYFELNKIG